MVKKVIFGFILTCILACIGIMTGLFWMADPLNLTAPKDEKLTAIFHTHRTAFEKLQQMAAEAARYGWYFNSFFEGANLDEKYRQKYENDPRYGWYFKSPYFEGGKLNESRRKEYKDLVSEINPGLTIGTDYDNSMCFRFAGGGMLASGPGWAKGMEYLPGSYETNGAVYGKCEINWLIYKPQWKGNILTNLDNARTLPASIYLRHVESNWFIYYQRFDD
jgi:hypothetical protein